MAKKHSTFLLGLVTIGILIAAVAVLFFLADVEFDVERMPVVVRFPHHQALPALSEGSLVTCGGLKVGEVTGVWLEEAATENDGGSRESSLYLHARTEINESVGLRSDCRIVPVGPLLGGSGRLVIRERGVSSDLIEPNEIVDGESNPSFDSLVSTVGSELDPDNPTGLLSIIKTQLDPDDVDSIVAKIHRSLDDVNQMTRRLEVQLDSAEQATILAKVHEILDHVNSLTTSLASELNQEGNANALAKVHEALDEVTAGLAGARGLVEESRPPVGRILGNVDSATRRIDQDILPIIREQLDPANEAGLTVKVHRALDQVNQSLEDVTVITEAGRDVVVLSKPKILRAVDNFKTSSELLRGGIRHVARNPWLLFNKPDVEFLREHEVLEATALFAEAAEDLRDSMKELNLILDDHGEKIPADDPDLKRVKANVQRSVGRFTEAEQTFWSLMDQNAAQ